MQPFALCLGNQHLSTLIQLVRQLAPIAIVPQEKALNDVPSIERRTEEWKPRTLVFGPLPAISVNSLGKVKKVLTWPEDKHNHHRSHCSGQLQLWRQCNKIGKVGEGVSENGDVRKLLCVCVYVWLLSIEYLYCVAVLINLCNCWQGTSSVKEPPI